MENILEVFLTYISDGGDDERFENMIKSRQFSHLKVPQIKTLLTYYHTHGYPLPRAISTLKKGDLIKLLNDIVDDEIKKESRRLDREIKPNYQTSSSLSTRPPSLPSNNPPMPHPGSSMTSLQDPLQHDFEESDESDDVISTLSAGSQPPSDLPVHEQIIRNPLNRTVLADLKMSFFTLDQIVDAIKESYDTSDAIIDFDVVMFAILNKVEPVRPAPVFDEESFNRDLDMAILHSEGERDAIQMRKKRRKLEVQTEKGVSLSTADEFRRSALLGKQKSIPDGADSSVASNSPENGSQLLTLLLARLESDEKKMLLDQSSESMTLSNAPLLSSTNSSSLDLPPKVEENTSLTHSHSLPAVPLSPSIPLDSAAKCSHRSSLSDNLDSSSPFLLFQSCCCSCRDCTLPEQILSDLRSSLSSLLFIESDAYKWYKEDSIPYFLKLGSRLDQLLVDKSLTPQLPSSNCCPSTVFLTSVIPQYILPALKIENEAVTRILLLFPSGTAGGIPEEFRNADPDGIGKKWQVKDYDIEDDGFEIIGPAVNTK